MLLIPRLLTEKLICLEVPKLNFIFNFKIYTTINCHVFSERERSLCCRPSVCLSVVCRLPVVSNVRVPYSVGSNFRQYFYGIRYLGHLLTSVENLTEIVPGLRLLTFQATF